MHIGVPTEVKNHEYRVAITPAGVNEFVRNGHTVVVEAGAGLGSSITDAEFEAAGASIAAGYDSVWSDADMILKVKEPIAIEYDRMRPGQVLFTYLHLAAGRDCTHALLDQKVTGIAYETVQLPNGTLPLLAPMSEVAGRLAPQVGAYHLMRQGGGRGTLMGGVSGVYAAKVVVIGAGVSGMNAAAIALGMQACMPSAMAAAFIPETPAPITTTLAHRRRGHAAHQRAAATALAHQVVGPDLGREPTGDLAHRGQQRQRAVGRLDGLVRDPGDLLVEQRVRAVPAGGQVEVSEQHLPRPHPVVLDGDRLLDLQDHVRVGPDLVVAGGDGRPGGRELGVGDRGPSPAPASTTTAWPFRTNSLTPAGVMATRYSWFLTSVGTPICIWPSSSRAC